MTDERFQEIQENEYFSKGWRTYNGEIVDVFNTNRDQLIKVNNYVYDIEGERDDLLREVEILKECIQELAQEFLLLPYTVPDAYRS